MGRAVLLIVAVAAPARAAPWVVTAEGGAELDTNVQRVETGPGLETPPISSGVVRFGARIDHGDTLLGGRYVLGLSDLTRIVDNSDASVENVAVLGGDLRWLHPVGDRPVSAGIGLTATDALPLSDPVGARTFSNLGADAVITVRSGEESRLTFAFGLRSFVYKPDHDFDWIGPTANGRLDLTLWQSPAKTRSLELATSIGFESRNYAAHALVDTCPSSASPDPACSASSDQLRRDRYQRAGVELTWAGAQVVAVGYQLTVIDSNSYGESLARHRVTTSGTFAIGKFYATLLAILQIDQYLDGLVVQADIQHAEFTNVEDENRSSLQARLARKLSPDWSIEARAAVWRNIASSAMELSFQRELVYAGVVFSK